MVASSKDWTARLERWLAPFLDRLGHAKRRRMCPLYIAGLIGPGDRKSVQPMAERFAPGEYDRLHHFVASGAWHSAPLEAELLMQADRLVGGADAVLVIDDTALPKKGSHSVGVAPQYATTLGKNANCQTMVSVTLARGEVPVVASLRLFLPESWTSDPDRMSRARVPDEHRAFRTKTSIAIEEIDRLRGAGVRFGCVLADAGYGLSAPFRQALSERGLAWTVGIPRHQKVYRADVALVFPTSTRGRKRLHHIPDAKSVAAHTVLGDTPWRTVSWRRGTKGRLVAKFAALRVRVADGPTQRIRDMGNQHMPGEDVWLIGEHRSNGERKHYLSNLPVDATLKALAASVKARWICEQAHQQMKEELGLDHFEGRSWIGLHRHALMTMIACAFLQSCRLDEAGGGKKNLRATPAADPASRAKSRSRSARPATAGTMSALP